VAWWFCHWRNFWLKVLQQRRHQKSIKALTCSWYMCHVVYRYPNMPTWTKPVIIHEHDKTSSISTFQIFLFPSLPTLRQGRGDMETDPIQPLIRKHTTDLTRPHRWIFRVQTRSGKPESPTGCSPDSMKKWSALLPKLESQDYWTVVTCPVHRWWFFRVKEWKTRKTCGFLRVPNFQALTEILLMPFTF
jgi:hypothetical protein